MAPYIMCTGKEDSKKKRKKIKYYNWVKSNNRKYSGVRRDETGQSKRTQGLLNSASFLDVAVKPFAKIRALDAGKQA